MGLSRVFDIAQKSLATYQSAIDVTSNNIANSSNTDYSRQQVILSTSPSQQQGNFIWGTGVQIAQIQRVRDQLTEEQIRATNSKYSDNSTRNDILNQVQTLFSEPSDVGLSSISSAFFNSWEQLSVTPNSTALRNNVIQAAQNLSEKIQTINKGFDTVKTNIYDQINSNVTTINADIKQIQSLNTQIFKAQSTGLQPNDLLDNRDKVIADLSKLVNINVSYDSSNSAVVSIGGAFVADRGSYTQLKVTSSGGKLQLTTADGSVTANLSGGSTNAMMDLYNNKIPGYQSSLDSYVNNLMTSVNAEHSQGYTISNPSQTNINFFDSYTNGVLTINSQVLNDPQKIAVSKDGTSGNGDIALNISGLLTTAGSGGTSLQDQYNTLIANVGNDTKAASDTANSYNLVLQQLNQQKDSNSGVSVDEEMMNVIKYQRSYDASAKIVKMADDMLQTLLNMVG